MPCCQIITLNNNKSLCKNKSRVIFLEIKKRFFIRVVSYLVAVSVIIAATGLFSQRAKAGYEETLGKVRMTNLGSMCEYFRDISAGLRLLAVSADNSVSDSISYVDARIMGAISCLNGFNEKKVKNISDFLNTVNKFTDSFTGTSEKRKISIYLSEYAQEVYYHLDDVSSGIINGAYSLTEYGNIYQNDSRPYFEDFVDYSNGNEKELFNAAAPVSANSNSSYFKEKVTEETAMKIAGGVAGINPVLWRKNKAETDVYSFCHGDTLVNVTKAGMVCRIINPVPCKTAKNSLDEAEKKAAEYLEGLGYKNIFAMRREKSEFTASFLFYPEVNGVVLLTCPIMIDICLSSGALTFMDSYDYIRNYRNDVESPENLPDVGEYLPEEVAVSESYCCLKAINGKEKICMMSVCRYDDYNYYIYTDIDSMKIVKTENG